MNNERDVVVTGVGPVTSIGVGADAFWAALLAGRSGVRKVSLPVDVGRSVEVPVAAMPSNGDVPGLAPHVEFLHKQDCAAYRDLAYTLRAVELALADSGLEYDRAENEIGVVQAFEAPGAEAAVTRMFETFIASRVATHKHPAVYDVLAGHFYSLQPFVYVHLLGKRLGLHGFSTSVHNACASAAFALDVAAQRIRGGDADVMLVAGGEAFDTSVRLEWFRRLELYSADGRTAPFTEQPGGLCVGEGAAAIVLESRTHAEARGARVNARYRGGRFAQQSWKQAIPDVRAARLRGVIAGALEQAEIEAEALDLILPHGAGTAMSDGYEARCLGTALGDRETNAIATANKPNFGHLLAASGLVELIVGLLALREQTVPPTLHTPPGAARFPVPLAYEVTRRGVETVLKLSTGFTGHDAATVLTRV